MPRKNQFTIYDKMEKDGVFDSNPANAYARTNDGAPLYSGPHPYPKMLYHPLGELRVIVPGAWETDKTGRPSYLGEQSELIWQIVNNEVEEKKALAAGWHNHPAKAVRARVEAQIEAEPDMDQREQDRLLASIPPITQNDELLAAQAELRKLKAEKAKAATAA